MRVFPSLLEAYKWKLARCSGVVLDSDGADEYRECLLKSHIFNIPQDGVIETFRRLPNGDIPHKELHVKRFEAAIGETAETAFEDIQKTDAESDVRIRLIARDGATTSQISSYIELETPLSLALSRYALEDRFQETQYKTTVRDFYDGERARLNALIGADEVIFLNAKNELCEGSFTSIFIEADDGLLTPALSCGLLPSVLRQALINQGKAAEAVLTLKDLTSAKIIFVGNSLRGLMPAKLIDDLPH